MELNLNDLEILGHREMQEKISPSREEIKCGGPLKETSLALEEQQQKSKHCGWNMQGRRVV